MGQLPHHIARENGHLALAEKLEKATKRAESGQFDKMNENLSSTMFMRTNYISF